MQDAGLEGPPVGVGLKEMKEKALTRYAITEAELKGRHDRHFEMQSRSLPGIAI